MWVLWLHYSVTKLICIIIGKKKWWCQRLFNASSEQVIKQAMGFLCVYVKLCQNYRRTIVTDQRWTHSKLLAIQCTLVKAVMKLSKSSVRKTIFLHMPFKSLCISRYHYAALLIILVIQSQSATFSLLTSQSLAVKFKSALSLWCHSAQRVLRSPPPPLHHLN